MRDFLKKAAAPLTGAKLAEAPARAPLPAQLDARARSLDVARTMLKGAVQAFREEVRKDACEQRVNEARAAMVFWRERMQALLLPQR